jgi:hypothetical protein
MDGVVLSGGRVREEMALRYHVLSQHCNQITTSTMVVTSVVGFFINSSDFVFPATTEVMDRLCCNVQEKFKINVQPCHNRF